MIFSKGFINFVYVALSGGTLLISVMSQQYNCLMELYTNFYKSLLFMKMYLPSTYRYTWVCLDAEMNVHLFMVLVTVPTKRNLCSIQWYVPVKLIIDKS